jgi:single-strand DNA-binding protein
MLKVLFIGNLGNDPTTKFTQAGKELVEFSVAVNQRIPPAPGSEEWRDKTDWFRVRVMGRQVQYAQGLAKGTRVHVIGNLSTSAYLSKQDGEPRVGLDVFADEVTNLSPRGEGAGEAAYSSEGQRPEASVATARPVAAAGRAVDRAEDRAEATSLEDLPF